MDDIERDEKLVELIRRSLHPDTYEEFDRRVQKQATKLRESVEAGEFDVETYALGLELETYGVDEDGRLSRFPDAALSPPEAHGELGLHNVELNTAPTRFDEAGLADQAAELRQGVTAVREALADTGVEPVLDGMWPTPPAEGTREYLGAIEEFDDVVVARNMRASPRYCAIDNEVVRQAGGTVEIDLPGVSETFPTILFESTTTSIQPHLQVPFPGSFTEYYNVGIRTLGPVLALGTNSPFLPADLYEDLEGGAALDAIDAAHHEHRIPVFERVLNDGLDDENEWKVCVPDDIEHHADVVDRLAEDRTCAPFLREWLEDERDRDSYTARIWEFDHKRGTYWRWLRAVVGGQPVGSDEGKGSTRQGEDENGTAGATQRSIRIEYRPIPTQPSVRDVVAFQAFVSGLLHGLVLADHPVAALDHGAAVRSFYAAVEDGLDADLAWVTADGDRTSDPGRIYPELFEYARRGLRERGIDRDTVEEYLRPVRARWEARTTPSIWRKERARDHVDDGANLRDAIVASQRAYVQRQSDEEVFVDRVSIE